MKKIKTLVHLLRMLKSDLLNKEVRFQYMSKFCGIFPGNFGSNLRKLLLKRYALNLGERVAFWGNYTIFSAECLSIGNNVGFAKELNIQAAGGVSIGDNCVFGPFTKIWSRDHEYNDSEKPVNQQGFVLKPVIIGNDVWVGSDVFIMPGTEISDGCIISAGAVVGAKKYPPYSILAGNPARKIATRTSIEKT